MKAHLLLAHMAHMSVYIYLSTNGVIPCLLTFLRLVTNTIRMKQKRITN